MVQYQKFIAPSAWLPLVIVLATVLILLVAGSRSALASQSQSSLVDSSTIANISVTASDIAVGWQGVSEANQDLLTTTELAHQATMSQ